MYCVFNRGWANTATVAAANTTDSSLVYWNCYDFAATSGAAYDATIDATGTNATAYITGFSSRVTATSRLSTIFNVTRNYKANGSEDRTFTDGESVNYIYTYGYSTTAASVTGANTAAQTGTMVKTAAAATGLGSYKLNQFITVPSNNGGSNNNNANNSTGSNALVNFAVSMFAFVGVFAVAAF